MDECIKTVDALNAIYDCPTKIDEDGYIWVRTIDAVHKIDEITTADVRPVVHGEWDRLKVSDKWQCSVCGVLMDIDGTPQENLLNFCPNCGADMTS